LKFNFNLVSLFCMHSPSALLYYYQFCSLSPIFSICQADLNIFIYIYIYSLEAHTSHLKQVLETLKTNQLYVKRSKCTFAEPQGEYLGHIILAEGVTTDPKKTEPVQEWRVLKSIKELRGFLGLAGYYKKCIRKFGFISKPLTDMLKKNNFLCTGGLPQPEMSIVWGFNPGPAWLYQTICTGNKCLWYWNWSSTQLGRKTINIF